MARIGRKLTLLVRRDRTHKLYQRVQVIDQGKSCSECDDRKTQGLGAKGVASFVFEVIAGNVPE
jgi:hypothetical protein